MLLTCHPENFDQMTRPILGALGYAQETVIVGRAYSQDSQGHFLHPQATDPSKCVRHSRQLHPRPLGALYMWEAGGWKGMILAKDTANHAAFLPWSSEVSWMLALGRRAGRHFCCFSFLPAQLTRSSPWTA